MISETFIQYLRQLDSPFTFTYVPFLRNVKSFFTKILCILYAFILLPYKNTCNSYLPLYPLTSPMLGY